MKCILLAAGYATRLYPLTENFPKPLLKIGNSTILDRLIDDIGADGDVDFIVVTNHRFFDIVKDWAGTRADADKITVLDDGTENNETRLGAVRDIAFAIEKLSLSEDLLVLAGDNLVDFSMRDFVAYAKERGTSCIMRHYEEELFRLQRTGVIAIDEDDRVLMMQEKPKDPVSHWAVPPFYYYVKSDAEKIVQAVREGICGVDAPGDFIAWLCGVSPVHAFLMKGHRFDIGTLESYEEAKKRFS